MQTEIITPKDEAHWLELRKKDITSTDVAALFNLSSYCTPFELWHRKKSQDDVEYEEKEWTKWGKRFEDSIARGVAEDEGWIVEPFKDYVRIPELRMGASFDYTIMEPDGTEGFGHAQKWKRAGLLEIKNVFHMIFNQQWEKDDDGNYEAPPHIELQVQHQLMVSGLPYGYICAMVGGNKVILIKREPDLEIFALIRSKVAEFWDSIEANKEPEPDFQRDTKAISQLYNVAEPGRVYDAFGDDDMFKLVQNYIRAGAIIKEQDSIREEIKNRIITMAGDSEKVAHDLYSITMGTVPGKEISYYRKPYRMFKINPKKELKESLA